MTDADSDAPRAVRVRPYLLTGGRTKSDVDLALEAQLSTTAEGEAQAGSLSHERQAIVELCRQPVSVAEVSAHLKIHLQVARILLGDLITDGLVSTGSGTHDMSERPDLRLLERVLDGLQSL